jgi:hypothetical protein
MSNCRRIRPMIAAMAIALMLATIFINSPQTRAAEGGGSHYGTGF